MLRLHDGVLVRDFDSVGSIVVDAHDLAAVQPSSVGRAVVFNVVANIERSRQLYFERRWGCCGCGWWWIDHAHLLQCGDNGRCYCCWVVVDHRVVDDIPADDRILHVELLSTLPGRCGNPFATGPHPLTVGAEHGVGHGVLKRSGLTKSSVLFTTASARKMNQLSATVLYGKKTLACSWT